MRLVKMRKMARGDRVLTVPKELAEKIKAGYMSVQLDELGRLTYTPVAISEATQ